MSPEPQHLLLDLSNIPSTISPMMSRDDEEVEGISPSVHEVLDSSQSISASDLANYFREELQLPALEELHLHRTERAQLGEKGEREEDSGVDNSLPSQLHEALRSELERSFATYASSKSSSGASDTAFLPPYLPNSTYSNTALFLDPLTIPEPRQDSSDAGELEIQMMVDRNRQRFVQRYLITSSTPVRRSFSLASFDYTNVIADTLQYVEEDRQSNPGEHFRDDDDQSLELGSSDKHLGRHSPHRPQFEFPLSDYSQSLDSLDHPGQGTGNLRNSSGRVSCRTISHDTPQSHRSFPLNSSAAASLCYICYVNESNACFMKCGHGGLCYSCAIAIARQYTNQCPICRKESVEILKIMKRFSHTVGNKHYRFGYSEDGVQVVAMGSPNSQSRNSSHVAFSLQFSPAQSRTTSSRGRGTNSSGNNGFNSTGSYRGSI